MDNMYWDILMDFDCNILNCSIGARRKKLRPLFRVWIRWSVFEWQRKNRRGHRWVCCYGDGGTYSLTKNRQHIHRQCRITQVRRHL